MRSLAKLFPLVLLALAVTALVATARADDADPSATKPRPNVVWLVSEDNSVHYLKLYGAPHGETPNIAKLATEGLLFEHAFSNAPVCSVARTTLQTGMYAPRIGAQFHRRTKPAKLPDDAELFPESLRDAGYYTTNNVKTDYNVVVGEPWDDSSRTASWRNRPSKETPFFHMQSFGTSHEGSLHFDAKSMETTETSLDPDDVQVAPFHPNTPTFRYTQARYYDRITAVDAEIGNVLAQLRDDGLLEDTVVFYFGDHGGVLPGSKGYLYETGLHVPLVVRVGRNVQHLVDRVPNTRVRGFVSFVDFGPTVLNLAGVDVPESMDGRPFLGPGVTAMEVDARDETYGHADRFDEKYDLVRSLRKGRFKYLRNYEAFYPPGLQNNYRYEMLAYEEWRDLFGAGLLNDAQRRFFEPKPVEELYDLDADPFELNNLAESDDETHREALLELRGKLSQWVKGMPDTSFLTEKTLIEKALPDAAAYGQEHAEQIGRLVEIADLALLPFDAAEPKLQAVLASDDPWQRYWALTDCTCFGEAATTLVPLAKARLEDDEPLVRVRAAEFLGSIEAADPRPTILDVLATSDSYGTAAITLNSLVYLRDVAGHEFDPDRIAVRAKGNSIARRLEYLRGETAPPKPKRRQNR